MAQKFFEFLDKAFTAFILTIAVCVVIFVFALIGYMVYSAFNPPEYITLTKHEWRCEKKIDLTQTTFIMVGKVSVPSATTSKICINWVKKENK